LQRRPQENKIDALLRARSALGCCADRSGRQVECDTRDGDRQGRGIEAWCRPARPQHVRDIAEGAQRDGGEYDERNQEKHTAAAPLQRPSALSVEVSRRHGAPLCANQCSVITHQQSGFAMAAPWGCDCRRNGDRSRRN
jgi:hypothetical protein